MAQAADSDQKQQEKCSSRCYLTSFNRILLCSPEGEDFFRRVQESERTESIAATESGSSS
jgi:hypothetical protein